MGGLAIVFPLDDALDEDQEVSWMPDAGVRSDARPAGGRGRAFDWRSIERRAPLASTPPVEHDDESANEPNEPDDPADDPADPDDPGQLP
jgi:hypothetical protein